MTDQPRKIVDLYMVAAAEGGGWGLLLMRNPDGDLTTTPLLGRAADWPTPDDALAVIEQFKASGHRHAGLHWRLLQLWTRPEG